MDNKLVSVTFDNQVGDHLAADRLYYNTTPLAKVDRLVAVGLAVVGVVGVLFAGLQWWTLLWFVLAPLEWFNLLSIRPLAIRFWFKRNPKSEETYRLDFGDSGVHFVTGSIDSRLEWKMYSRLLENDKVLLLIYGPRMYTVIPKRAFQSQEQLDRLRVMVEAHLAASV